ncbi:MAG: hypothetical protein K1060chlam1_01393 [Candidatus Anoxychlamydiales bacterium]|nr:hypothetical protein [Candidatus Anoxychlamydiales bacterium]
MNLLKKFILKFKWIRDKSPNLKMQQKVLGNENRQYQAGRDINFVNEASWIEKRDAAKEINNAFKGFLLGNINSLETHSSAKQQKSILRIYKKSLKKQIKEKLTVLNNSDQNEIQQILDNILSKEKKDILTSRDDSLTSVEAILKCYE